MLDLIFRFRGSLLILVAIPIAWGVLVSRELDALSIALGAPCVVAAAAVRLSAIRQIGKRARVRHAGAARLLEAGPYGWVRNPLYVANLLTALGAAFLAGCSVFTLGIGLFVFLIYEAVIRSEEVTLLGLFGPSYDDYRRRVRRWFPRLRRLPAPDAGPNEPWPWSEVLRREAPAILGGYLFGPAAIVYLRVPGPGVAPALDAARTAVKTATGLELTWVVSATIAVGALADAVVTETKRRRHERSRAIYAAELAAAAAKAGAAPPDPSAAGAEALPVAPAPATGTPGPPPT